jgi:hypothetical protein
MVGFGDDEEATDPTTEGSQRLHAARIQRLPEAVEVVEGRLGAEPHQVGMHPVTVLRLDPRALLADTRA